MPASSLLAFNDVIEQLWGKVCEKVELSKVDKPVLAATVFESLFYRGIEKPLTTFTNCSTSLPRTLIIEQVVFALHHDFLIHLFIQMRIGRDIQ